LAKAHRFQFIRLNEDLTFAIAEFQIHKHYFFLGEMLAGAVA